MPLPRLYSTSRRHPQLLPEITAISCLMPIARSLEIEKQSSFNKSVISRDLLGADDRRFSGAKEFANSAPWRCWAKFGKALTAATLPWAACASHRE
jgi:hypothetical protein